MNNTKEGGMERIMPEIKHEQQRELVCSAFDHDCFGLDGNFCAREHIYLIGDVFYHVEAADGKIRRPPWKNCI
jgi:hypothetical protein